MDLTEKKNLVSRYESQIESFDKQIEGTKEIMNLFILRVQRSATVAQLFKTLATKAK